MSKVLTPEAEDENMDFIRDYGYDGNCSCHLSPPCNSCIHPGNPLNQAEDESCWMGEPEPLPANARILVSRNKREGWYRGRAKEPYESFELPWEQFTWAEPPRRHARTRDAEKRLGWSPFKSTSSYGTMKILPLEFGTIERFRIIVSPRVIK